MRQINMHQAKTHLSRLVEEAAAGEEIVIAKAGKPVAKLVAVNHDLPRRPLGLMQGQRFWMADDFDGPLPPDLLAAFYGEDEQAEENEQAE